MTRPAAKGWCPSAHAPMMSGDGLLVRIKPRFGQLRDTDLHALANLAEAYGNGVIDLTSRANLQLRGVREDSYPELLGALQDAGLVDADPLIEQLNLLMAPFTQKDSLGWRCAVQLYQAAGGLLSPRFAKLLADMPAKFGFAIDCGATRYIDGAFSDICIECDEKGALIIRCSGIEAGFHIDENQLVDGLCDVMGWYLTAQPKEESTKTLRMRDVVKIQSPKPDWQKIKPVQHKQMLMVGATGDGAVLAAAYGQLSARDLRQIAARNEHVVFTINRQLIVQTSDGLDGQFIQDANDARLQIAVCPGRPHCASASVQTRALADKLVAQNALPPHTSLHISGCEKGCAAPAQRDVCITGQAGLFDVIEKGCAWDAPSVRSLDEVGVMAHVGALWGK